MKSASCRVDSTGIRRSGEAAFLQPQSTKSGSAYSALTGVRRSGEAACFQLHSQSGLHPEELGTATGHGVAYDPRIWQLKLDNEKIVN